MGDVTTTIENEIGMQLRRITVEEYHRMGEAEILSEDERVELLDGVLIRMPPIGAPHEYVVGRIADLLRKAFGGSAIVRANSVVTLPPASEPQPDVIVARAPETLYRKRLPGPADILLLVEVAHSSRRIDRGPKSRLYARAGVEELWVVDLVRAEVVVFREPGIEGYVRRKTLRPGDQISPARFADVSIAVSAFLESAAPTR
jgi:Uma2 family endonuclease